MKTTWSLVLIWLSTMAFSQTAKVLIVGDSWAQQQYSDQIHDAVFDTLGYPDIEVLKNADATAVAIDGTTASDWVVPSELQKITDALVNNPSVDTVQLTIGGNDFLNNWDLSMTMMEVDILKAEIVADIQTIVDAILAVDINIEIIMSFYDYPNFAGTTGGLFGFVCGGLHDSMLNPSPQQLNEKALEFTSAFVEIADQNPKVFHVPHWGRMQNAFGFPDENIEPGDITLPGGDITRTSRLDSMRDNSVDLGIGTVVVDDCFHLKPEGYDVLVEALYNEYYQYRFDTIYKSLFE